MIKLFDSSCCIDIFCENTNKFVQLALNDLIQDFERVSKGKRMPKLIPNKKSPCIVISENTSTDVLNEGFEIKTVNGCIYINADSYMGTMWGIYTFSEKILGVDPLYLFNDLEAEKKDELYTEDISISDCPDGFTFRGVFINDEDLLTDWKTGGGKRNLDYPWYGTTVSPVVVDRVAEALVRLKINLVIPASFLDIANPPEKAIADAVADRGIFLSQHHIEPCGVSSFTFDNYCKKHGISGEFSYIKNPDLMKKVWREYIKKWSQYDNVVWQIGLRGKADRPFWGDTEPEKDRLAEYGRTISEAYECQKQIILEETCGRARHFTSTLWMEGAGLMAAKVLKMPEDTVIVFADNGVNQMYAPDFYETRRENDRKYGIYYHLQYWGYGPHLAPLTGIDKLYHNLKQAKDMGDTAYCILNSSNIREFAYELKAYSQMMWNFDGFSPDKYADSYASIFGDKAKTAKKLVSDYYDAIAVIDTKSLPKHHGEYFNYKLDDNPQGIKNFTAKDGMLAIMGRNIIGTFNGKLMHNIHDEIYETVKQSVPKYLAVAESFEKLASECNERLSLHVRTKWLMYSEFMYNLYEWYCALYEAKRLFDDNKSGEAEKLVISACEHVKRILENRKCAEYGEFESWYRGDTKFDVPLLLCQTESILKLLTL